MRFPTQATIEDLKALIAPCSGPYSSHILWIHHDGEVQVMEIYRQDITPELRALLVREGAIHIAPLLVWGDDFVGADAVADSAWMADFHRHLRDEWDRYECERAEGRFQASGIRGTPELLALLRCLEKV